MLLPSKEESSGMQHKLRKIVLLLILLMAVCSPFMQLDSWDMFPIRTDDIELVLILNLSMIGMFFALAGLITLFPALFRTGMFPPTTQLRRNDFQDNAPVSAPVLLSPPLRI